MDMKRTGYMCAVDFEYHVGEGIKPVKVYSSPELAIEERKCVTACGLIEVEITIKRYMLEPTGWI